MTKDIVEDILSHHGIKGMRWGVRKDDSAGGGVAKRAVKGLAGSPDAKTVAKSRAKSTLGVHRLSDAELKKVVSRMNLEQQYSDLKTKESARKNAGLKKTLSLLGSAGKFVAGEAFKAAANAAAQQGAANATQTARYYAAQKNGHALGRVIKELR